MSAVGNKTLAQSRGLRPARGFTLIELLVVLAIVALASVGVSLAWRDSGAARLEQEALRLAALLEAARAQSRASGTPVFWQPVAQGFRFDGLPPRSLPEHWQQPDTQLAQPTRLLLGPEPLIGPQTITLLSTQTPGLRWQVASDGLRPFSARRVEAAP